MATGRADDFRDDLPDAKKIVEEPGAQPFRVGSLVGVIPPPPDAFFDEMTEEEIRGCERPAVELLNP